MNKLSLRSLSKQVTQGSAANTLQPRELQLPVESLGSPTWCWLHHLLILSLPQVSTSLLPAFLHSSCATSSVTEWGIHTCCQHKWPLFHPFLLLAILESSPKLFLSTNSMSHIQEYYNLSTSFGKEGTGIWKVLCPPSWDLWDGCLENPSPSQCTI